jgi:ubiquinone/menaquinone biosynthesis C-methylase UbiE
MAAVVFARAGADVEAFDLSPGYVDEAERRAEANGVSITLRSADAEHLPYYDESFDAVWGSAILHHLDLIQAGGELHRVLKSGGVAVFCEPWGGNPFLNFARRWLPYPGKHRTRDERPLNSNDLRALSVSFPDLQVEGYQFFAMLHRVFPNRRFRRFAEAMDRLAFRVFPILKNCARYIVIVLRKR